MIALEVSSATRGAHGGVPGAIRHLVSALVEMDPDTRYILCSRLSRWRKSGSYPCDAPNARTAVLQDPWNRFLLRGARVLHSMGIFLPRTPRIPKLVTVHDLNAVRNPHWVTAHWHARRGGRIRAAVERADHVVTYSAFTAQEVCEAYGLPKERVHPIHLGVDRRAFRRAEEAAIRTVRARYGDFVLSVGLITPRKNFPALVEAVASLGDVRLVLLGRPSDGADALTAAIAAHRMESRVTLLRGVPHEELLALMSAARVYAVPSLYEGFGLTVLEAMACGVPVVCSDAASLPEAAGDAALLADASRPALLAEALARVLADPGLAEDLARRGLARAREMSWEAAARRLRALYRDVAGV
jgi:alpha-1,3-rhamnosyl/mannosyltransferase